MSVIQFIQVYKKYPKSDQVALRDINFSIDDGEFVFLIGPSGSGKTSIMRMLIHEEKPSQGKIYFDDFDITKINRSKVYKLRRLVGVVFQDYKLIPNKNVYENVAFAMEVAGQSKNKINETVENLVDIVGLTQKLHSFPHQLSGGEQQRVAIARAIANSPRVLIADEPTGNLDPASAWDIVQILTKINSWGTTVLMSTHGTDIVNSLNKRVIQLHDGQVVRDDSKGQYELTRTDFSDQMLKSNNQSDKTQNNKNVIKVDLRTDKIREKMKQNKVESPLKVNHDIKLGVDEEKKPEPTSRLFKPFKFLNLSSKKVAPVEEVKKEQPPVPEVTEPESLNLAGARVTKEVIKEEIKQIDENVAGEIDKDAAEISVNELDLSVDLIKRLLVAGYNQVNEIIEAGPDKLVEDNVIDPIEVIELSQALSEFVADELEIKPTKKVKKKSK